MCFHLDVFQDQYRMCYQAILAYLDSFEESQYQNFM